MNRQLAALFAVAVLAAAGGYFAAMQMSNQPQTVPTGAIPDDPVGLKRPDFSHLDTAGQLVTAAALDGKTWLLNFWATWCEPCVEEMPMLSELRDDYRQQGFEVVGIAIDDPVSATAFAGELGLSYPVLVGGADVVITGRRYGNRTGMLPYSVLVDRDGTVRWVKLGALERADLENQIKGLLSTD